MEFRLFGEVQLLAAGHVLEIGTPRQQEVLAALVIDAGLPVAIETIIDRIWDDAPPTEARNILYSHVSRIRQLLKRAAALTGAAAVRVERRHAGYILDVDPDLVDLHRFGRLVDHGRDPGQTDVDRVRALAEALGLWRGAPLAAFAGRWAAQVRSSWHRRRLDAAVQWAQLELRLGNPDAVIATMPDLVTEYPLAEPLEGLLMEALHAAGRDAEAIDRYATVRERLADELGTDPSPELRTLHRAILRGEPPPARLLNQAVAATRAVATPAQLPPDVYGFTGRDSQLRHLDRLLAAVNVPDGLPSQTGGAVVISAIDGTAGVGKTALAVRWAHRVAARFPDGQLYVNLRGFDPTGSPLSAAEAIRGFLDAFDVPPNRIPATLEAQVGLYRSLLAPRRVLVVLDNARAAEHVRPLLPGARGCMVVVTSRNQLAGLVATGAQPMTLGLPTTAEARKMLAQRLGAARVAAEPSAVDEIIALCARLPLALAIVATRATAYPDFGLAVLAAELRVARGGLGQFACPDPATDARTVFSWSYQQLPPATARLFRLLGLHAGPDITVPAVASLAGIPIAEARQLLAELAQAHLVEHIPGRYAFHGRYTFHDLLGAYARELARTLDTDAERDATLRRALSHYVHTAHAADRLLNPQRDDPVTPPPIPPGVFAEPLSDQGQALAWFGAERRVLLATVRHSAGDDELVWQLAWTLIWFFAYHGLWHDTIEALSAALRAGQRLADPLKEAFAHRFLGCAFIRLGRLDEAHTRLSSALDLYRQEGDMVGQAHIHRNYSWLRQVQQRHREGLAHAQRALDLFQAADHPAGHARAVNAVGWFHAQLGGYPEAISHCLRALELQRDLGDRFGQAETLDSLGYAHGQLGQHTQAITCYRTASALYREFGDQYNQADTTASLGDALHAAGDAESARDAWQHALDMLELLGHHDADGVRAKLAGISLSAVR